MSANLDELDNVSLSMNLAIAIRSKIDVDKPATFNPEPNGLSKAIAH